MISEQRSNEGSEGTHHADIWGKAFQAQGTIGKGLRLSKGLGKATVAKGGKAGKGIRRWRQRGQGVDFSLLKEMGRH